MLAVLRLLGPTVAALLFAVIPIHSAGYDFYVEKSGTIVSSTSDSPICEARLVESEDIILRISDDDGWTVFFFDPSDDDFIGNIPDGKKVSLDYTIDNRTWSTQGTLAYINGVKWFNPPFKFIRALAEGRSIQVTVNGRSFEAEPIIEGEWVIVTLEMCVESHL